MKMNKIKTFVNFFTEIGVNNAKKEVIKFLTENEFSVHDIYDVENVTGLISSIKLTNVIPRHLYEGIDFELDNPGGVIIFSTDLNSTLGSAESLSDKVKFFFDSKWKTFLNRLNVNNRLRKILLNKYELPGYTVGKNFRGNYTGKNGITFNEKSFTIDIAGVDSETLALIASEICREFKQETVMVRDFNKNSTRVYFVNDEMKD
jgi:hypothetical protein